MLIGLIADTHGVVRPAVHSALAGVDLILHAGDVGGYDVISELETIAAVRAVFGNTDPHESRGLVHDVNITLDEVRVHVSHGHELGIPTAEALLAEYPEAGVIVFGHTHRRLEHRADGRLVVNPGAAGEQSLRDGTASVAHLTLGDGEPRVAFIEL